MSFPSMPELPRSSAAEAPWGTLHYVPIVIAPPASFIANSDDAPRAWFFPHMDASSVLHFLVRSGLSPELLMRVAARTRFDEQLLGTHVSPEWDLIDGLSREARRELYVWLSESVRNVEQADAFRFCGSIEQWLSGGGLAPETRRWVERFSYEQGHFTFLADIRWILPHVCDSSERVRLLRALSREATLLMKLRVRASQDVDGLLAYWGRGYRHKDIGPLLESLTRCPDGELIDIVHLLPPFARRLLYTYPPPPRTDIERQRDCHWTSFNFFNEVPDDRYLEVHNVLETLQSQYVQIAGPAEFGDLVLFCHSLGEVFHSAVHIADDILFTKNGPTASRPWMLMRLSDLIHFYPRRQVVETRVFRRRDFL